MQPKNSKALWPDKLILTSRLPPKRWIIDLDKEGLGDATREEILAPAFWHEAHGAIQAGDFVSLTSATGANLDVLIGPETANGFHVAALAERDKSSAKFTEAA